MSCGNESNVFCGDPKKKSHFLEFRLYRRASTSAAAELSAATTECLAA